MESAGSKPVSNGPVTIYRLIKWPAHLLGSRVPKNYSSLKELSKSNSPMFEITQTRDGIVATSDFPETPEFLARKILQKFLEKRGGKKKLHGKVPSAGGVHVCRYCQKSFDSPGRWRRHVNVHTGEVKYPCPVCGKEYLDKSTLSRHKKIHSGEKPWSCKICEKPFHTLPSLRRHMTVHNPAWRPFECDICKKRFSDRSSLQKHIFAHTGLRPHLCSVCNKSFVYLGDLNCHMKIHAVTKEFRCAHCKKEFAKLTNYQRHVKIHEGNKTFQCSVCHVGYNFQTSLTRHMITHRLEKLKKARIMCRFCDARFSNRSALKRHLLLHYTETVKQKCKTGVENIITDNCDSKNDINKRPLTRSEISFVRKNLKYCVEVRSTKTQSKGPRTTGDNQAENQAELNRDVKNIEINSGDMSPLRVLDESQADSRRPAGQTDTVLESSSSSSVQKKRRGRPRKIHVDALASRVCGTEQPESAELRSDENVGKRNRGRPSKKNSIPVRKNVVTGTKENEMFSELVTESLTRKRGRPRKNVNKFFEEPSHSRESENCENRNPRRSLRKVINSINKNKDMYGTESKQKDATSESRKTASEHFVEQKRKRGRPRKSLQSFSDQESHQLQSQVMKAKESLMDEISVSVSKQNNGARELERNEYTSEEMLVPSKISGTSKIPGNFDTTCSRTTNVNRENEQSGLSKQTNECNDKMTLAKQIQLPNIMINECMYENGDVCDGSAMGEKTGLYDGEMGVQLKRDHRRRLKEQICETASHQKEQLLQGITKDCSRDMITNNDTIDILHTVLTDTRNSQENYVTVTLTCDDTEATDPSELKLYSKQTGKILKELVLIESEDCNDGWSTENNACAGGIELKKNCERAKRLFVNDTETLLSHNSIADLRGSQPGQYVVINVTENCGGIQKGGLHLQGSGQAAMKVQGHGTEGTVMRDIRSGAGVPSGADGGGTAGLDLKGDLLDDWQSDNSCSSESLQVA